MHRENTIPSCHARPRRVAHVLEAIDLKTAALVVIDLAESTVVSDDVCQRMTETLNTLAAAVRQRSGGAGLDRLKPIDGLVILSSRF